MAETKQATIYAGEASPATFIARGLALGLSDSTLREQLRDDLRDSPFPRHRLHMQSYFTSRRGRPFLRWMVKTLNISEDSVRSLLRVIPALEIAMPASIDRVRWKGDATVVVVATLKTGEQLRGLSSVQGFALDGSATAISLIRTSEKRVISLTPVSFAFPADPEVVRAMAPRRVSHTISTPDEEFATAMTDCPPSDPDRTIVVEGCGTGGPSGSESPGPPVEVGGACAANGYATVNSENDLDADGIRDDCEAVFAMAFEPQLWFDADDHWSDREPYYTVGFTDGLISIGYLIGYYFDGPGWSHPGDSEWIVVRIRGLGETTMAIQNISLSAHWGACCGADYTRTLAASTFQYTDGRPYIWVSQQHHSNYESEWRCDERWNDVCGSGRNERLGIGVLHPVTMGNIGRGAYPFNIDPGNLLGPSCARSKRNASYYPGVECFHFKPHSNLYGGSDGTVNTFGGWLNAPDGETRHYQDFLWIWHLW